MALTVDQIMAQIAATVNQDATTPTDGGSEWTLWLSFMNRAQREWAEGGDWEELRAYYYPTVTGTSVATLSLPGDFRRIAAPPRIYTGASATTSEGESWPEELPENWPKHIDTDKYYSIIGNPSGNYSMLWHPGTLASGASIQIQYFSIPTSLASPTDVPKVADAQFFVDRVTAYIFEARSDPRFQEVEVRARDRLMQMVENMNIAKYSSFANPNYVSNGPLSRAQFRMGRD